MEDIVFKTTLDKSGIKKFYKWLKISKLTLPKARLTCPVTGKNKLNLDFSYNIHWPNTLFYLNHGMVIFKKIAPLYIKVMVVLEETNFIQQLDFSYFSNISHINLIRKAFTRSYPNNPLCPERIQIIDTEVFDDDGQLNHKLLENTLKSL